MAGIRRRQGRTITLAMGVVGKLSRVLISYPHRKPETAEVTPRIS
jgi:hypothetical protein